MTRVTAKAGPGPSTTSSRASSTSPSPTLVAHTRSPAHIGLTDCHDHEESPPRVSVRPRVAGESVPGPGQGSRAPVIPQKSALHVVSYGESNSHHHSHARFQEVSSSELGGSYAMETGETTSTGVTPLAASAGTSTLPNTTLPTPTSTFASSTTLTPFSPSHPEEDDRHPLSIQLDIEHAPVTDDPRKWSDRKKTAVLILVAMATLTPMLATSIYNPAFEQLRTDLGATDDQLALSVSLFILFQGCWPIFWSSIGEVKGRKWLYIISFSFFITGSLVASRAQSMKLLIGMRMVQAFGSSSVLSLGAGTLSDMYEKHERGTKLGIYYGLPLLGPSAGPILGGFLASGSSWRATFYLIAALAGATLTFFFFLPDSWRKERSQLYSAATRRALKRALAHHDKEERSRAKKLRKGLASGAVTPGTTVHGSRLASGAQTPAQTGQEAESEKVGEIESAEQEAETDKDGRDVSLTAISVDLEKNQVAVQDIGKVESQAHAAGNRWSRWRLRRPAQQEEEEHENVVLTFADVNPFPAMWAILEIPSNLVVLISSGLLFACQYTIPFTAAVTFAEAPYNYQPWRIGLVLLAFGGGNVIGSLIGGRYSDYMLRRLKKANDGVGEPEMRLKSTTGAMFFMVPSFLTYAWVCQEKVMIAGPIVALFGAGFFLMIIYASALAYLVDANPGRSSSAVAANSFFRGVFACICSQISLPIRNAIGDGGLYTLLSGVLVISCLGFFLTIKKGKGWRHSGRRLFQRSSKVSEGGKEEGTMR